MTAPVNPFRQKPKNPFRDEFADVEGGSSTANEADQYGFGDALANGLLAGFRDEARAAYKSGHLGGPEYQRELSRQEEGARRYKAEHPMANVAAEGLGMVVPALASGGESALARLGVASPLARAAIEGAGYGAAYGAGNAPSGHKLAGAGSGAVVGGLMGPATQGAAKLAGSVAELVPGVNTVGRALGVLPKPQDKADQLILRRMAQDELTPGGVAVEVGATPNTKPEVLMDVAGDNTRSLGQVAFNSPGVGRKRFAQFVEDRQAEAPSRIGDDLSNAGMNQIDRYKTKDALIQAKRQTASPLYEAALQGKPIDDDAINAFLDTPEGQAAFKLAQGIRRKEAEAAALEAGRALRASDYELPQIYKMTVSPPRTGNAPGYRSTVDVMKAAQARVGPEEFRRQAQAHIDDLLKSHGELSPTELAMAVERVARKIIPPTAIVPTVAPELEGAIQRVGVPDDRTLHYMKLALDDMAKFGYVPPGGSASTKNYASKALVGGFRQRIGQLIPGYDDAAQVFQGGQAMEDAFDAGHKFLRADATKTAGDIANMTPAEKDLFRMGAGNAVSRQAGIAPDGSDIAKRVFGSPEKRAQIEAAVDNPQAFGELSDAMGREKRMAVTNSILRGSRTQPMQAEQADAATALSALASAVNGSPAWAAAKLMFNRARNGMTQDVTDALTSRLMSGAQGRQELLSALEALQRASGPRYSRSGALANLMAAISGSAMGSSVR